MVSAELIDRARQLLFQAAPPGSGIILFGSSVRGDARIDSDLDFLVIEPEVEDQHREMVRLRDALRPLRVAADVVVTSRKLFEKWHTTPNNVLFEAAREGRVLHAMG